MKSINLTIYIFFFLGLFMFTACEKENVDVTDTKEEEVITETTTCDLELIIAEQPPGSGQFFSSVSNGIAPYSYLWSTGDTTANISITGEGTYSLIVTDAEGCNVTEDFVFTAPDQCEVFTAEIIENSAGLLSVVTTEGTAPYLYEWSTGETTNSITVNGPGTFSVTVTDSNGCVFEDDYITFSCPPYPIVIVQNPDGTWTAIPDEGTAPYFFEWSTGDTTNTITITVDGTYSVTVADATDCTSEAEITVTITDPCLSFMSEIEEDFIGSLITNTSGGTTPYSYLWSTEETTSSITTPEAGLYSVTVTDANGCVIVDDIDAGGVVSCNDLMVIIAEQPPGSGQLFTSVTGGTFPFLYSWSTGETTPSISPMAPGTYSVTIEDANGCTGEAEIEI